MDNLISCIPTDHANQVTPEWMVEKHAPSIAAGATVVDLGCGAGRSHAYFNKTLPNAKWIGVDIEDSPEVRDRAEETHSADVTFLEFDGINVPLPPESVDLIYSRQVLEHVRHPEAHLKDACRILKKGGLFIGSTSQLEPYHSYQYWNFTAFGFNEIVKDAGFIAEEIRPGIDGRTLIERTYLRRPPSYSKYFTEESPMNLEINGWGAKRSKTVQEIILKKLDLCGQFIFCCKKV